jgi:hypothetical protein
MKQGFEAGLTERAPYSGWMSWKFGMKIGGRRSAGRKFLNFVQDNPGYDVYFINPFTFTLATNWNVWTQGEIAHPGLTAYAKNLLMKAGLNDLDFDEDPQGHSETCYCNFWIATPAFWRAFMDFILPIYRYIEDECAPLFSQALWRQAETHTDSAYIPFIFERLFSVFLRQHPEFRVAGYRYSRREIAEKYNADIHALLDAMDDVKEQYRREPKPELRNKLDGLAAIAYELRNKGTMERARPNYSCKMTFGKWHLAFSAKRLRRLRE